MQGRNSISVVIPTYNRAHVLLKAIRSVLAQTFQPLEILVCDDGSTDNSKQLVSGLSETRVRWLDCGRNGLPAIPRNKGIEAAKGEWIAFLDSDDEWLPAKLASQIAFAQSHNVDSVSTNGMRLVPGKEPVMFFNGLQSGLLDFYQMTEFNQVICSSMMCRRELLIRCGMFPVEKPMAAIEDYVLWLKVASAGAIGYLNEPLMNYTDNPVQSIRSKGEDSVKQRIRIFNHLKRHKNQISREHLLFLYRKFKWFYKSGFFKKIDIEGRLL